jgi:hypothetical protein
MEVQYAHFADRFRRGAGARPVEDHDPGAAGRPRPEDAAGPGPGHPRAVGHDLGPAGDLGAADIGKAGVEQAIAALKGEPVQKKIGTGFVVVTKDNMNDPDVKPFLYKSTC